MSRDALPKHSPRVTSAGGKGPISGLTKHGRSHIRVAQKERAAGGPIKNIDKRGDSDSGDRVDGLRGCGVFVGLITRGGGDEQCFISANCPRWQENVKIRRQYSFCVARDAQNKGACVCEEIHYSAVYA